MSKGAKSQTTTTQLPAELQPLASAYTNKAMDLGNQAFQPYMGQRFAGMNGDQTGAIDMIRQRAQNGSPVMDQANSTLMGMLQGGQSNPYLDAMVNRAQQSVVRNYNLGAKPQMESAMVRSGSFGNSGLQQMQGEQQRALGENLGNVATSMYGDAYNTDRQRQVSALGMAPTFGNQAYSDAGQLMNAGTVQQQNAQNPLDFNYQQFQDQQNLPYKQLQAMGMPFGSNLGMSSTTKDPGMTGKDALGNLASTAAILYF